MSTTNEPAYDAVLLDGIFRLEDWLPYQCSFVANRVSALLARKYHDELGISASGWRVVAVLGTHPPMSAKDAANLTGMDQVSVTRAVNSLVEQGFVVRKTDVADRRRVVLRLGRKGVRAFAQVVPLARAAERILIEDLAPGELAALRRALAKLVTSAATSLDKSGTGKV